VKRKPETNPQKRAGRSLGRRRLPKTYLGVKRRFLAIVRSAAQEVDELKTLLHPSIDGIVESPPSPTPETHLLGMLHLFASNLEEVRKTLRDSRLTWPAEHLPDLQDAVCALIRQRAAERIRDILLEIAKGLGASTPWRKDLEYEIWYALSEGQAIVPVDISGYAAELRELTAISHDWWRWNPERNRLQEVWVEDWREITKVGAQSAAGPMVVNVAERKRMPRAKRRREDGIEAARKSMDKAKEQIEKALSIPSPESFKAMRGARRRGRWTPTSGRSRTSSPSPSTSSS